MESPQRMTFIVRLILLAACLLAPAVPVSASVDPGYMEIPVAQTLNTTVINNTSPNGSLLFTGTQTLAPVILLHLELNETTPSGVRYMAFEPKVIEIAVSPILLVILAGLAGGGAGAWYILGRNQNGN